MHQGLALKVPPYEYAHPIELLDEVLARDETPLLVALDGITDPRNLGAILRSTGAFGGQGVIVPQRRSVGVNAAAWKTSAGAAARDPRRDGRRTSRRRSRRSRSAASSCSASTATATSRCPACRWADRPIVIVVGSEGKGLSRLVAETCDAIVSIPIESSTESLNAGIAASVTLYEISKLRASADADDPGAVGHVRDPAEAGPDRGRRVCRRSDVEAPVVLVVGVDDGDRGGLGRDDVDRGVIAPVGGPITVASSRRCRRIVLTYEVTASASGMSCPACCAMNQRCSSSWWNTSAGSSLPRRSSGIARTTGSNTRMSHSCATISSSRSALP